jgi:hypothetical protein
MRAIQMAITSDRVREISRGLESGDETAFFERVRHQKQPPGRDPHKWWLFTFERHRRLHPKELEIGMVTTFAVLPTMLGVAALSTTLIRLQTAEFDRAQICAKSLNICVHDAR